MALTEYRIARREIETIMAWAKSGKENFRASSEARASGFQPWQDDGVREYDWENTMELKGQLEAFWHEEPDMRPLALACAIAAYKLKRKSKERHGTIDAPLPDQEEEAQVPDFIYAF